MQEQRLALRPTIASAVVRADMSADEQFQNATLRPILKLQHPLLMQVLSHFLQSRKKDFKQLSAAKKEAYIYDLLLKNQALKNELKGMLIGQFTLAEYQKYQQQAQAINKRMMQLLKQRLADGIKDPTFIC